MIKPKVEVLMNIWMEQNMWEIGKRIDNKVMELKLGPMELSTKVIMKMEKSMGLAHLDGRMDLYI